MDVWSLMPSKGFWPWPTPPEDAASLAVTTLPLWGPLLLLALLSLGATSWRIARPRVGWLLLAWGSRRLLRWLRRKLRRGLPGASAGGAASGAAGLRRSLSSTLCLRDAAAVDTVFASGCVGGPPRARAAPRRAAARAAAAALTPPARLACDAARCATR
jgi:hypothetical protein